MLDDRVDFVAIDPFDFEHDASVIEEQGVASAHVVREILVVEAHAFLVAEFATGVENEAVAGFNVILPFSNFPTRIFGPCKSARMPTGRPSRAAIWRTVLAEVM